MGTRTAAARRAPAAAAVSIQRCAVRRRIEAGRNIPRSRRSESDQEKRMERYLPVAAALLALPHLLSIAAARHEPPAAVAAQPPRTVSVSAPARAHCAALRLPVASVSRAAPRRGFAGFAQQPYLQP
ncbi:hypothetical protein RDV84_17970 [Lysobacter yananisis]|jgi:hypothetical protein|uniref:ESPR domain-containing protein n=1 Tax=Lysobacter yananisis TaxID=1003114 RepID=A0ABY9P4B4_9GAMM|nr:hypothetical protein [Lysobacter yananisis]WMT01844.1 hypothetical protein RDV84_17970 [Lysobacter yananisis]